MQRSQTILIITQFGSHGQVPQTLPRGFNPVVRKVERSKVKVHLFSFTGMRNLYLADGTFLLYPHRQHLIQSVSSPKSHSGI